MTRKIAKLQIIAFAACIFFHPAAQALAQAKPAPKANTIPTAVTEDPAPPFDRKYAASMSELSIPSAKGEKMNGIMYLAAGAGVHPTVVLLHGFPGNEQNLDLAQSIRRAGWNVLYFHYRGAWGSAGDFSFANAMQDTLAAIKFLRDPANYVGLRVDTSKIVLVGHSMGGFMAAYAAAQDPQISGVVLISPWNIGLDAASWSGPRYGAIFNEFQGYERALHGTRAGTLMAEAMEHAPHLTGLTNYANPFDTWEITRYAEKIRNRNTPVLLTYGTYEDDLDVGFYPLKKALEDVGFYPLKKALENGGDDSAKSLTTVTLPTDHAYSDHRIALQSAVVEWLERLRTSTPKPAAKVH